jgi:hypothetical protein
MIITILSVLAVLYPFICPAIQDHTPCGNMSAAEQDLAGTTASKRIFNPDMSNL